MQISRQLAKRFREVIFNGLWIANTNYKDQLSLVTRMEAIKKIESFNTIAALTYHVNYYIEGILNYLEVGVLAIKDQFSFDLPEIVSNDDWECLKNNLWTNSERFATHIETMTNEQLQATFVDEKYGTHQRNIDGVIEHCYYHLGQIVLIRKLINASENH